MGKLDLTCAAPRHHGADGGGGGGDGVEQEVGRVFVPPQARK
jgi:hypothetical protein